MTPPDIEKVSRCSAAVKQTTYHQAKRCDKEARIGIFCTHHRRMGDRAKAWKDTSPATRS